MSTHVLLFYIAAFLRLSESSLVKVPGTRGAAGAGVFMLIEGGHYTLNFTAATAACLSWNVTMATRAQMERAVQQGLETCKFGWIHERIAVIPRLKSDQNCGQGRTGLVQWLAAEDKRFAVYCFNTSDLEETPQTSTTRPQTSMFSTRLTAPTQTSGPTRTFKSTSPSLSLRYETTTSFSPLLGATRSAGTVPAFDLSSTRVPAPNPSSTHLVNPGPVSAAAGVRPQSVNSAQRSALSTGLVVGAVVLLLLAAAAIVWLHKRRVLGWSQAHRDDAETEMWKHTDGKMDTHNQSEDEEEDEAADRRFSSEVQLCVNPHVQHHLSQ